MMCDFYEHKIDLAYLISVYIQLLEIFLLVRTESLKLHYNYLQMRFAFFYLGKLFYCLGGLKMETAGKQRP